MVAALASSWGVEPLEPDGKIVWAVLDPDTDPTGEVDFAALADAWAQETAATYTVRLGSVSTGFLLETKAHIDNVVRELILMRDGAASSGVALAPELADLIDVVTSGFDEVRTEIKRQAVAAAARGEAVTELVLNLSPSAADEGERYLLALDVADDYARAADLLTLASPPEHRSFRRWYVRSIVEQIEALSEGRPAPPPSPYVQTTSI